MVFKKIDLPWHKHTVIANPKSCSGCMNCIENCPSGAIAVHNSRQDKKTASALSLSATINISLLIFTVITALSGFILQIGYHMGGHGLINTSVRYLEMDYYSWAMIHKASILLITPLFITHTILHWNWYRSIVKGKKLKGKNKTLILTSLFMMVALTGYLSWIIHIAEGSEMIRKLMIELHDKLTILLFVFLLIHIAGRLRWFKNLFRDLFKKKTKQTPAKDV